MGAVAIKKFQPKYKGPKIIEIFDYDRKSFRRKANNIIKEYEGLMIIGFSRNPKVKFRVKSFTTMTDQDAMFCLQKTLFECLKRSNFGSEEY